MCARASSAAIRRMRSTAPALARREHVVSASKAHLARTAILHEEMERAGVDALLVYGNSWHADSLRYATDFGIQEGQALALVAKDGSVTLLLDDQAEAERAAEDEACEVLFA